MIMGGCTVLHQILLSSISDFDEASPLYWQNTTLSNHETIVFSLLLSSEKHPLFESDQDHFSKVFREQLCGLEGKVTKFSLNRYSDFIIVTVAGNTSDIEAAHAVTETVCRRQNRYLQQIWQRAKKEGRQSIRFIHNEAESAVNTKKAEQNKQMVKTKKGPKLGPCLVQGGVFQMKSPCSSPQKNSIAQVKACEAISLAATEFNPKDCDERRCLLERSTDLLRSSQTLVDICCKQPSDSAYAQALKILKILQKNLCDNNTNKGSNENLTKTCQIASPTSCKSKSNGIDQLQKTSPKAGMKTSSNASLNNRFFLERLPVPSQYISGESPGGFVFQPQYAVWSMHCEREHYL